MGKCLELNPVMDAWQMSCFLKSDSVTKRLVIPVLDNSTSPFKDRSSYACKGDQGQGGKHCLLHVQVFKICIIFREMEHPEAVKWQKPHQKRREILSFQCRKKTGTVSSITAKSRNYCSHA